MRNKKKIIFFMLPFLAITVAFFIPDTANASIWDSLFGEGEDTKEIVKFLREHSEWLQYASFMGVILHAIAWFIVKGLYVLVAFMESLIPESMNLLNFLDDSGMQGLVKAVVSDLVVVLIILTLVYLGFKTVIAKEPPKFKNVGVNIFISAFLIIGLPTLMDTMEDISTKFYDATQKSNNNGSVSSLSWNLIQNNTADLMYVAESNFDLIKNGANSSEPKNKLTPETFKSVDLNEVITPDAVDKIDSADHINSLKYTLSVDSQGNFTATKIDGSLLSFFSDKFDGGYFRYPAKFFPIIVGLVALFVAYLFTIFVFASTAIEIGFKQILAPIIFSTDLESGQRTKMVIQDIGNAFMLIAFTGLSLKLYTVFLSFLANSDINILVYVIAMIAATFILIKGSSTIMRYFGVDVGVKDGFAQLTAAFALGRSTANLFSAGKGMKNLNNAKDGLQKNGLQDAQGDEQGESLRKDFGNTLKNSVNSAGKTFGYLRNRGVRGAVEDSIRGSAEKIGNNISDKGERLSKTLKDIKTQWNQGVEEGGAMGQSNREKWQGNENKKVKSINDQNGDQSELNKTLSDNDKSLSPISSQGVEDNSAVTTQKQKLQKDLNSIESESNNLKSNSGPDLAGTARFKAEEIENPKFNDKDTIQRMKLSPSTPSINESQGVSGNMKINTSQVSPSVQKILQQVEQTSFTNPEIAKQSLIQEVQRGSFGNNEVKQRIIQEVEQSSFPTPQQLEQNVRQVLTAANVPGTTQNAIQKVIQEVQNTSQNPETVKAKVIQEIQNASFGNDSIKQSVIQDVQKAFTATPEQIQQNIKQSVENIISHSGSGIGSVNTEQKEIKTVVESNIVNQEVSKKDKYFGSLIKDEENNVKSKKPSRFDKFFKS
ncbi:hypothetical protein NSQ61_19770 [Aeribacillus sp. FSL K6-1121]|uniref:pLS20_p028 family conjugation system transmembrane protein n=1 Tax=Aeribacillus sp. FSL K6-1121 TaxID=2954745 RepID=UPI0030F7B37B